MLIADKSTRLQKRLEKSLQKGKYDDALLALFDLQRMDRRNPRWARRIGDIHRRIGNQKKCADAYEHAVDLYAKKGFITHAVAMAKTVLSIDPTRKAVLERVDPTAAQELLKKSRPPMAKGINAGESIEQSAQPLERANDEKSDELRFNDAGKRASGVFELSRQEVSGNRSEQPNPEADPDAERMANLPFFPLFADIPREALNDLVLQSELVELEKGQTVIKAGDKADSLYAIVEGQVIVDVPEIPGERDFILAEGEVFGEACLLNQEKRSATITTETPITALRISKPTLDALVKKHPHVGAVLLNLLTRRLISNLVQTSELFVPFDVETRQQLALLFEVRHAKIGTRIIEQGKRSDAMYIPLTGYLNVAMPALHKQLRLNPGSIVGAMSLISQAPAEIQVDAGAPMILLRLPASRFNAVAMQYPPALEHLGNLVSRLTNSIASDRLVV
ncbi:MAG: cyclic nucleotide-binding domain-containing protein [Myxococcales bacterium]|nr:MAG: cyclic nucleotide-binding domain-containing protein [Myxococcales bacterium]